MPISSFGYDTSVGQQPGPGGWWGGATGGASRTGGGAVDYSPTSPSASGDIGQIADLVNSINRGAQTEALGARIPQAPQLEAKSSSNIASELGGQLPPDVLALLGENAAQAGVASGSPGNPAAYLRALGLTSLDLQQRGQQNLTSALARNPAAPIYDVSKQLITPYESAQLGLEAQGLAGRSGGGGAAPRGTAAPTGYGAYSPETTTSTAPGPMGPSIPFDWYSSTFPPGSVATTNYSTGGGTISQVPQGSELFPNEGVYVDPATMQAYDYSTGQPVDYFNPATSGTNLQPTPVTPTDYSWDQVFAGLTGT